MASPTSIHARRFYRVALQRLEDVDILWRNRRLGAAIYLAGYAVECMLKALVLQNSPRSQQQGILQGFRGASGHNYDSLHEAYRRCGAPPIPKEIASALAIVNRWSVELRYEPKAPDPKLVTRFMSASRQICHWAEGRF